MMKANMYIDFNIHDGFEMIISNLQSTIITNCTQVSIIYNYI